MDKKISNKRVNVTDILHIAEIIDRHCQYYKSLEKEEKKKKEEARARDEYYNMIYISGTTKFYIQFNDNETISKEDDIGWFSETLLQNASRISEVTIYFSATEDNKRESLRLNFTYNRIDYDTTTYNMADNPLANMVESYINNLPPRFDELVDKDTRRKMIPALTISIPLGIIVGFVLLILARVDIISSSIAKYLTNGFTLTSVLLIIAFFGALLIPTKNTNLYKNIKFETYYAGYDDKTNRSIHKTDYAEYKSRCEVAIGQNANMPQIRQSIEENYKKAKKIVMIELLISVVAIALFFIF